MLQLSLSLADNSLFSDMIYIRCVLCSGVDQHLVEKILDPTYLDGEAATFSSLQGILSSGSTSATAWVGEAGGAYNSGHHLVTDSFVFSFW